MFSSNQIEELMRKCIDEAWKYGYGIYRPYVGALVLSEEDKIIATGTKSIIPGTRSLYIHAEREALIKIGKKAKNGTLVTTLEPCVRIPNRSQIFASCVELIVNVGLQRVIVGKQDTAYSVNGKGIKYLRSKGIEVEIYNGPLLEELERIYRFRTDRYVY